MKFIIFLFMLTILMILLLKDRNKIKPHSTTGLVWNGNKDGDFKNEKEAYKWLDENLVKAPPGFYD